MEWLLLGVAAVGGGSYAAWRLREVRSKRQERAAALEAVKRVAEEDVTIFGEQIQRLGDDLADRELDQETRDDYQTALDAYEDAKRTAPRLAAPDEVSSLVDTLATGRYRLACVRARAAGQPVPEFRVACFFNPQHGPSTRNVMYTVSRRGTQQLSVCSMCAARVAAREKPEVLTVHVGPRTVPYWEAGAAFMPYSKGYFPLETSKAAAMTWAFDLAHRYEGVAGLGLAAGGDGGLGGDFGGDFGGVDGGGGGD